MREIKFRLWSIHSKKMFGCERNFYMSLDGDLFRSDDLDYMNKSSFKVMQYTGLKDKNGKEIFEGDIVQGRNRAHDLRNIKQKVTFLNGCFMFGNWNAHEYFNKHQEIEIIGNIYENPELLEAVE